MTLDQLSIFVAVAEREHLTRAADVLRLTPSAVSAAIKALERFYGVRLFDRVGRGIELTREGRVFLSEARETLARIRQAEMVLGELGDLKRGSVDIHASQTIANYWLPGRLMRFHRAFPGIEIRLTIGNTAAVTRAVAEGTAELGFIEGSMDRPDLSLRRVAGDGLAVVAGPGVFPSRDRERPVVETLREVQWVMRESGSGTRSEFEAALRHAGVDPAALDVVLTLPSNEAVLSAVREGRCATALSRAVVTPFIAAGELEVLDFPVPERAFTLLRHRERHLSMAAGKFVEICLLAG